MDWNSDSPYTRNWKRNLPHIQIPGALYYVTFSTARRKTLDYHARDLILDVFFSKDEVSYRLWQASIMPDHVHIVFELVGVSLPRVIRQLKGISSRKINLQESKTGTAIWQAEYWDRIVRNQEEYNAIYLYIAFNAVEAGLSSTPLEYRWYYSRRVEQHRKKLTG